MISLNETASEVCRALFEAPERFGVIVQEARDACRIVDCGVAARGGLEAGRKMAMVSTAGLARISVHPPNPSGPWPVVAVSTDHPVAACMASQYAGWQVHVGEYFGMASGPMRAAAAKEDLFEVIGWQESVSTAVGVLESGELPSPQAVEYIAAECGVDPARLTLLVAPTASLAGTFQVVCRSVETAMHKLHELGFDLSLVENGFGTAPLPPVARNDLAAMGRTNDAILYGGEVALWVRCADELIESCGPNVPSDASADHGQPFARIFDRYDRDFYKIDPGLFAPAVVSFFNLASGRTFRFGCLMPDVLEESFGCRD